LNIIEHNLIILKQLRTKLHN